MCNTLAASSTEHVGWPMISLTSCAVAFTWFLWDSGLLAVC
jgi:hypothetical protein